MNETLEEPVEGNVYYRRYGRAKSIVWLENTKDRSQCELHISLAKFIVTIIR